MAGTSQTERLVAEFQSRTLSKAAWTHEAHLRVGLWHVVHFPAAEALDRVRTGIRALNEAHGTPNTDQGGYHETITRFYLTWIAEFAAAAGQNAFLDVLADALIAEAGNRQLPLLYYTRERLFSAQARLRWLEPDLRPIHF